MKSVMRCSSVARSYIPIVEKSRTDYGNILAQNRGLAKMYLFIAAIKKISNKKHNLSCDKKEKRIESVGISSNLKRMCRSTYLAITTYDEYDKCVVHMVWTRARVSSHYSTFEEKLAIYLALSLSLFLTLPPRCGRCYFDVRHNLFLFAIVVDFSNSHFTYHGIATFRRALFRAFIFLFLRRFSLRCSTRASRRSITPASMKIGIWRMTIVADRIETRRRRWLIWINKPNIRYSVTHSTIANGSTYAFDLASTRNDSRN